MKKYITFLLLILLMPSLVLAASYESKTLSETLQDEEIESDLEGYDDNEEKPVIYLFRGKGCSHCYEFLEYVSSDLVKEKGDKFRLVTYEVWNNEANGELMQKVADYFKEDASGVPYIIIGDKTFNGYAKSMNKEIEEAIDKLNESEEKFDVLTKIDMKSSSKKEKKSKQDNTFTIVFMLFAVVALIVLVVTSYRKKEMA
ncbi:MAG: hypothetical protein IKF91_01555 [Bacilli bacterium]|nr:hypothetical protein [Bacilli bacterium]